MCVTPVKQGVGRGGKTGNTPTPYLAPVLWRGVVRATVARPCSSKSGHVRPNRSYDDDSLSCEKKNPLNSAGFHNAMKLLSMLQHSQC